MKDKFLSALHIIVVVIFGFFFITSLLDKPLVGMDTASKWYYIIWSIITIVIGIGITLFTTKYIEHTRRYFQYLYNKTHFFVFQKQAEGIVQPYMVPFTRAMGALVFIIGLIILYQNTYYKPYNLGAQQGYESNFQTMSFNCENGNSFSVIITKDGLKVSDASKNTIIYQKEESPEGITIYGNKDYAYTFTKGYDNQIIFTKRSELSGPSSTFCIIKSDIKTVGELDPGAQEHIKSVIKTVDEEKDYQIKFLDNQFFIRQNNITDNGQELRGFFKNGQIYKIAYDVGVSYAMKSYLYYFENGVLMYVYENEQNYPYIESSGGLDYSKLEPAFDAGYLFNDGKLAMTNYRGQRRMSNGKPQLLTENELKAQVKIFQGYFNQKENTSNI